MKNMADELDLEGLDEDIEKNNKVEKRIKDLSEKVRLTSEERDEKNKLLQERDKKIVELERENSFNNGFVDMLSAHPMAKDHKDEIKQKVLSGYSVEDATFAVLGKANQLGQPQPIVDSPIGGSAAINPPVTGGEKPFKDMTREEKRNKLLEAEARGELSIN